MTTPEGKHKLPDVPRGHMSIGLQVFACAGTGGNCPGAPAYSGYDVMCANGGGDVACSICQPESFFDGDVCVECGPRGIIGISMLMVCVVAALAIMFAMTLPKE